MNYSIVSFGCSYGVNNGNYDFKIKCIEPGHDAIGVITSIDDCKEDDFWITNVSGDAYFCYESNGIFHRGENAKLNIEFDGQKCNKWKLNDIIKINLNFDIGKVTFFQNNEKIGNSLEMIKNGTYYFVLCTQYSGFKYQII